MSEHKYVEVLAEPQPEQQQQTNQRVRSTAQISRHGLSHSNAFFNLRENAHFAEKIDLALEEIRTHLSVAEAKECMIQFQGDKNKQIKSEVIDIDLETLAKKLKRVKKHKQGQCCKLFFSSESVVGAFAYLFGSIFFSILAYFKQLPTMITQILALLGTSFYLLGGIAFLIAGLKPWIKSMESFNVLSKDIKDLNEHGTLMKQMIGAAKVSKRASTFASNPLWAEI